MCADELFGINGAKISCYENPFGLRLDFQRGKSIEPLCIAAAPNKDNEMRLDKDEQSSQNGRNEQEPPQPSTAQV